jgi:hypothetical protein
VQGREIERECNVLYCVPSALTARSSVSASVLEEEMSSLTPMASAADRRGRNCSL